MLFFCIRRHRLIAPLIFFFFLVFSFTFARAAYYQLYFSGYEDWQKYSLLSLWSEVSDFTYSSSLGILGMDDEARFFMEKGKGWIIRGMIDKSFKNGSLRGIFEQSSLSFLIPFLDEDEAPYQRWNLDLDYSFPPQFSFTFKINPSYWEKKNGEKGNFLASTLKFSYKRNENHRVSLPIRYTWEEGKESQLSIAFLSEFLF